MPEKLHEEIFLDDEADHLCTRLTAALMRKKLYCSLPPELETILEDQLNKVKELHRRFKSGDDSARKIILTEYPDKISALEGKS